MNLFFAFTMLIFHKQAPWWACFLNHEANPWKFIRKLVSSPSNLEEIKMWIWSAPTYSWGLAPCVSIHYNHLKILILTINDPIVHNWLVWSYLNRLQLSALLQNCPHSTTPSLQCLVSWLVTILQVVLLTLVMLYNDDWEEQKQKSINRKKKNIVQWTTQYSVWSLLYWTVGSMVCWYSVINYLDKTICMANGDSIISYIITPTIHYRQNHGWLKSVIIRYFSLHGI